MNVGQRHTATPADRRATRPTVEGDAPDHRRPGPAARALTALGFVYSALVTAEQHGRAAASVDAAQIAEGEEIYQTSCITCHGANLQGVRDRGPSLVGVGQAAVYFQVSTGRMPAAENGAQMPRKEPFFDAGADRRPRPRSSRPTAAARSSRRATCATTAEIARGGELFRLNCASCHNFTGQGGALSQGKYAPNLDQATDAQIYGAMLSGPENMPKFGDGQLTPEEKAAIIILHPGQQGDDRSGRLRRGRLRPGARGPDRLPGGHGRHRRRDAVDGVEDMSERRRANHRAPCRCVATNEGAA